MTRVNTQNSSGEQSSHEDSSEAAGQTLRDLAAILGILIPVGGILTIVASPDYSLRKLAALAVAIGTAFSALFIGWRLALQKHRGRPSTRRQQVTALLGVPALLGSSMGAALVARTFSSPAGEAASHALRLESTLIDSFSGYRLGIVGRMKYNASENWIPAGTELRYQVLQRTAAGLEGIYKQIQPSGESVTILDGIEPGEYRVRLAFYGLMLDESGWFEVDKKVTHLIALETAGHDVPVYFVVKGKDGRPGQDLWVEVVGPAGQEIRGSGHEATTDETGRTREPLWLFPLADEETRGYLARVRNERGQVVGEYAFRVGGSTEYWDRRTETVTLGVD